MTTSVIKQVNMDFMEEEEEEEEERYPCKSEGCDKIFDYKENLTEHTKIHEKEKKLCCLHSDKNIVCTHNHKLHQQQ